MKKMSFSSPEMAEYAFYRAFEVADLETMMEVWENSEVIVCIHPLGPRLQGLVQVRESWRQIFGSGAQLQFRIGGIHSFTQGELAVRIVYENISVFNTGADEQPTQPVIATNIYRYSSAGWRMILHHASPGLTPASGERVPDRVH